VLALGAAIGRRRRRGADNTAAVPLPIGSVKTNIGHTEPASGIAGLLKAMLVLQHGRIPASLHCATPNPAIDFPGLGLRVPTAAEPLPHRAGAVAGVNSFGFGGTNAVALLAAAPKARAGARPSPAGDAGTLPPLLLSARSPAALRRLAARWQARLAATAAAELPALLRGAARHRDLLPHRLAVRAAAGFAAALANWQAGAATSDGVHEPVRHAAPIPWRADAAPPALDDVRGPARHAAPTPRQAGAATGVTVGEAAIRPGAAAPIAFVFSGNGAAWPGMARDALAASAAFRHGVAEADAALAPWLGWSVAAALAEGVDQAALAATDHAQPLLFAVQHGIVAALAAQGIRPALCLGHSVGEVAAAVAAGLLDLPTAARLLAARSRHQHRMRGHGRMAALGASAEAVRPVLAACSRPGGGLEIAAINGPQAVTVAGPAVALDRLAEAAAERHWSFVPLDLDYAFHSAAMEPLRDGLLGDLGGLSADQPRVPLISTVTGEALPPANCDAAYWWRNLREPVRFLDAVLQAATSPAIAPVLFLEIGPSPVLQGYLRDGLRHAGSAAVVLGTLSRRIAPAGRTSAAAPDVFPGIADRAFTLGADPRGGAAFAGPATRHGLPATPFDRQRCWFPRTVEATRLVDPCPEHRLLGFRQGLEAGLWTRTLDTALEPWLADHRLAGEAVLPAAAMLEMALAAGAARHPAAAALEVLDFAIHRALPLESGQSPDRPSREIRTALDAEGGFALHSRRRLAEEPWTLHATGRVAAVPRLPDPAAWSSWSPGSSPGWSPGSSPGESADAPRSIGQAALLALAAAAGLDYGPAFRAATEVAVDPAGGLAQVRLHRPEAAPPDADFLLHPARLDGALQGLVGLLAGGPAEAGLVPVRFARLVLRRHAAPPATASLRLTVAGQRSAAADLVLRDAEGAVVAVLEGSWLQRVRLPGRDAAAAAFHVALLPAVPGPSAAPDHPGLDPAIAAAAARDAALDLSETALLLEGFCAAAAHAALLGGPATGPLARALLEDLARDGLAVPGPGGLRPVAAADLPPALGIWRQVLLEQPDVAPELAWLAEAAERLPARLAAAGGLATDAATSAPAGIRNGPDDEFPDLPPAGPPAGPGYGLPASSAGFDRLASVLAAAAAFAAGWPRSRPLRVLQIGTGPIGVRLAAALGQAMPNPAMPNPAMPNPAKPGQPALRVLHCAAALPGQGLGMAPPETIGAEFTTAAWDPLGAAPPPLVADLVIGLGVAAALAAQGQGGAGVAAELAVALRQAAAPGGAVLLAEPLPGRTWDFGCDHNPAWQDRHGGALPNAEAWRSSLTTAGWATPRVLPLAAAPWPAVLVAAQAPVDAAALPIPVLRRVLLFADAAAAGLRPILVDALQARGATVGGGDLAGAAAGVAPHALRGSLVVVVVGGGLAGQAVDPAALAASLAATALLAASAEGIAAGFHLVTRGGQQPTDRPALAWHEAARPGLVKLDPAQSDPIQSDPIQSDPIQSGPTRPDPTPHDLAPCPATRHDPYGAACFAFGRVLANEHPGLRPRRIDLDPAMALAAAARRLAAELLDEADHEAEITLTEVGRLVPRLRPGLPLARCPAGPARLALRQPGQLGSLHWEAFRPRAPGPGEVLLRIDATGINFRDLMWAQGLLPEETLLPGFTGPSLGMECAGVVEAVGPAEAGAPPAFQVGDRVFGVAPAALATHAVTRAAALALLPDGLGATAAATVPVAFLTAVYALEELARVEPGERVLIHGGAGAVGLAALQVALARGARVAATAGTAAKRAFLRAAGAELALDSRDPGFADALRAAWPGGMIGEDWAGGACVDVVLNSLAGDAMERSLGLLRPFGRFLELGKRDFAEGRRVALRPLRRNVTWFAVDVDELPRARPALAARLLGGVAARLGDGTLRPLPATEFPAAEVEAAFRTLQASSHIGKLVLLPPLDHAAARPAAAGPQQDLREASRGTVVVVGGTAGFGLAAARWLAAQREGRHGVRHLALLSRRGAATPGAAEAVRELAALGATATLHACDATDAAALAATLAAIRASQPPIRGVVHAAAVLADGAAATLDPAAAARVIAAKLTVAENLDRLTAADPLALFLLFSSATVTAGNPGQAAYDAANAGLDALARRRRALGRPALSIAWGPIADAGMLAADAGTAATLRRRLGATPMPAARALAALPALLAAGPPCLGLAEIDWAAARTALAVLAEPAFEAVRAAAVPDAADLRARLLAAPEAEALELLRDTLGQEVARILRLPQGAVAAEAPLAGLGLDSLGGMELRAALEQRLGQPVPLAVVDETLTVAALARRIAETLRSVRPEDGPRAEAAALLAAHEPSPTVPAASAGLLAAE